MKAHNNSKIHETDSSYWLLLQPISSFYLLKVTPFSACIFVPSYSEVEADCSGYNTMEFPPVASPTSGSRGNQGHSAYEGVHASSQGRHGNNQGQDGSQEQSVHFPDSAFAKR
jgi:hypothetical protein